MYHIRLGIDQMLNVSTKLSKRLNVFFWILVIAGKFIACMLLSPIFHSCTAVTAFLPTNLEVASSITFVKGEVPASLGPVPSRSSRSCSQASLEGGSRSIRSSSKSSSPVLGEGSRPWSQQKQQQHLVFSNVRS